MKQRGQGKGILGVVLWCMVTWVWGQSVPTEIQPESSAAPISAATVSFPPLDQPAQGAIMATAPTYAWPDLLRQAAASQSSTVVASAPILPPRRALRLGDSGPAVAALIGKLDERGFFDVPPIEGTESFDTVVQTAVEKAQDSYGLDTDGRAGPQLYLNLNRDPEQTTQALLAWADKVQSALDQARAAGEQTLVVVNIPSFYLHVLDVQTGEDRLESKVIVGMNTRRTPRYLTHIVNIKYNPDWTPPPSLVKRGKVYVPPGANNPLGQLRFSTDNPDNIYLHDTDEHSLFDRTDRARSSGCVRVRGWHELAEYLTGQDAEGVDKRLATGKTSYQKIQHTPVLLSYSLVDMIAGKVGVYPDVYSQGGLSPVEAAPSL